MKFSEGDRVYDYNGFEYRYVCDTGCGHCVITEGDEEWADRAQILDRVLTKPPVFEAVAELDKLRAEAREAHGEVCAARAELKEVQGRIKALSKRSAALKRIEDHLDGKVTHFALNKHGKIQVMTKEDGLQYFGYHGNKDGQKLLVLFGLSGGDLEWRLNDYPDGNGGHCAVVPCFSAEEATKHAEEMILSAAESARDYELPSLMASASACGVPFPADKRAAALAYGLSDAKRHEKTAIESLSERRSIRESAEAALAHALADDEATK